MALDSLNQLTIAADARELNDMFHMIGTPTAEMFDETRNMKIEAGARIAEPILYKDENTGNLVSGQDPYADGIIDPWEHAVLDWAYSYSDFVVDGKDISTKQYAVLYDFVPT